MAIVNYKTDYPLCILINNKEINKDYFIDKDFTVSKVLYLDRENKYDWFELPNS